MRIVQFMASGNFGGAEKVFVELANSMADHHKVDALVIRNCQFTHRFSSDVNVVELKSNPTVNNPFLHYEIFNTLNTLRPDLIHTHSAKATQLVNRVNRFCSLKHLGTKHNDRKGRIFNRIKWVTTVSEKARESIRPSRGGNVTVIHNGVIEEHVETSLKSEVFTMLGVGRLDKIKGFDLLLEQVAGLRFPFRLQIAGEGPEYSALQRDILALGLEGKVQLFGFREDIAQMMHDAHLVVISSHREGGPKVILEALLYAPVLVSTPVGAVPEVLPEKFQTSLHKLTSKIEDVYLNYSAYTKDFREIRDRKKSNFAFSKIVTEYDRAYQQIVAD